MSNDHLQTTRKGIETHARRIFTDTTYTYKGHFIVAESMHRWHRGFGVTVVTLSAIVAFSVIYRFIFSSSVAVISSLAAFVLTSITTKMNPGGSFEKHQMIANDYLNLQKKVSRFIDIDLKDETSDIGNLKITLSSLLNGQAELNLRYSQDIIPQWAYKEAKRRIEGGETTYEWEVDELGGYTHGHQL